MKKLLKLFVVKDSSGSAIKENGVTLYFSNKQEAKNQRQEGQTVSYGPDHHKFNGEA